MKPIFSRIDRDVAKKSIPFLTVLVFSVIIAIFLASWRDDGVRDLVRGYFNQKKEGLMEMRYSGSDVSAVNYDVVGQKYTAQNDDPQLVISGVNHYVKTITVFLRDVERDIPVEVFWGIEGQGFAPDRMMNVLAQKGTRQLDIDFENQVTDLRIDIGTSRNVSFTLDYIEINHKIRVAEIFDCMLKSVKKSIWFDRFQIFFLVACFVLVHFVVDIKKMYRFLFDKRWLVAGIVLFFLCINGYHGNSITAFDMYVQPGAGNDYIQPVLGQTRDIRSDEWMVSLPNSLSARYLDGSSGNYNYILRGTNTVMVRTTIISLLNPINLVGKVVSVFGSDSLYSYQWYATIFLAFLMNLEMFYIISSRRRLLSACGACMVVLSSHYLWWGFPAQILYAPAALVCAYYFFNSESWKKKMLFGYGTACAATLFVVGLYPAWQVPMGYVSLAIFVWIIHEMWGKIKAMTIKDWGIFAAALVLCIVMVADNLMAQREYIASITQTVYPGGRVDYGGFSLPKLFNYIGALLFPYVSYANPSESGMYLSLFPLPLIIAGYVWIKMKKKDWLVTGLLLISLFLGIYTTVGLPKVVATLTLMTNTTSTRCIDILGYAQVVLFVAAISHYDVEIRMKKKYAFAIAGIASCAAVAIANWYMPDYMGKVYLFVSAVVLFFVFACCLAKINKRFYHYGLIVIILIAIANGAYVRPIVKGMDAIYSKPMAQEIEKVASKDKRAKWIAYGGLVIPALTVACGAPTINSVNTYPNMDLWRKLDEAGKYDYVYNRYAHVVVTFTEGETSMELIQEDAMYLHLSYRDIKKAEIKYIASTVPIDIDNEFVRFEKLYDESGGYIYKVVYHK